MPFLALIKGFSLTTWLMIGMGIAIGVLYGLWKYESGQAEKWERTYDTFVAQTKAIGEARIARNKAQKVEQDSITKEETKHAEELYNALDMAYAAALARLRNNNSGSGGVQPLSSAASSISCPDRQADVANRLGELEAGILGLLQRGDKAIARSMVCKEWLDKQGAVKP